MTGFPVKSVEIRDVATTIFAIAIRMVPGSEPQRYMLRRNGFNVVDDLGVVLMKIGDQRATSDPYEWGNRTMATAHDWILNHWDEITDGDVIDVEFITGVSAQPKISERVECPI